jgi:hypothetical protein
MTEIDMDPRTAEFVEAASDMLRLSARIRPEEYVTHCLAVVNHHRLQGNSGKAAANRVGKGLIPI